MAQFDVYPNPSASSRKDIPWVVDIQSDLLSALNTRLVAPLATGSRVPASSPRVLCPQVALHGEMLLLLPHLAAPFRLRDLGEPKGNLRDQASHIVAALDAVISGV